MRSTLFASLTLASALAGSGCFDSSDDCEALGTCGSGGGATSSATTASGAPTSSTTTSTTTSTSQGPGGGGENAGGAPTSTSESSTSTSSSSDGGGGSSSSGDGGAGGSGGAGSGGAPPECAPEEGEALGDDCGVYVDAAAAVDGVGTRASPVTTLADAVAVAAARGKARIYVCDGAYGGAVTLEGGTELHGGYTCTWTRAVATRPTVQAEVGAVAGPVAVLTVDGAGDSVIADVDVVATLAAATPGASAIGVMAIDADLEVARISVTVDDAATGAAGDTATGGDLAGVTPDNGDVGCSSSATVTGKPGGTKSCGGATGSAGGNGGNGTNLGGASSDGDDGSSEPTVSTPATNGGAGEPSGGDCSNGTEGAPGDAGEPPASAPLGLGTLGTTGFAGLAGAAGLGSGTPGQGGGGGGGARGFDHCGNNTHAGPSGGPGGSGGCGGAVGGGGQAGGASIGVALVRSTLTADGLVITTGGAGDGGAGSPGQQGGAPGEGGTQGGAGACPGGQGGRGGWGGAGGGGLGGHSIAIALDDESVATDITDVTYVIGAAGDGGPGGDGPDDAFNGNDPANVGPPGNPGQRCAVLRFGVDPEDACEVAAP
jgi:hypothetical protein